MKSTKLLNLTYGFVISRALHTIAELDIASHLQSGPKTIDELAELSGANIDSLKRLIDLLIRHEVFIEIDGNITHSELSIYLDKNHPQTLYPAILNEAQAWRWIPFSNLTQAVRQGAPIFQEFYKQPVFAYLAENSTQLALAAASEANYTRIETDNILTQIDFNQDHLIADIGGGQGQLLSAILAKYPVPQGLLFDLKETVELAKALLETNHANRVEYIVGNFFEAIPSGASTYILKRVLHNWNDEECLKILSNCEQAMDENSRLLIIEPILDGTNKTLLNYTINVFSLPLINGKERTLTEFDKLLAQSLLYVKKHTLLQGALPFFVLEVKKLIKK